MMVLILQAAVFLVIWIAVGVPVALAFGAVLGRMEERR